ncbi:MAG: TatD family hydrolase [Acidimicrobiales bacterium]
MTSADLPPLDCHAHIAPDVTASQLDGLGDALIFAVTRSLDEADLVLSRRDRRLVWGCGVHPGVASARASFNVDRFSELLARFALVGEIGLDRRAGSIEDQTRIFCAALEAARDAPVLVSVHSAGCTTQVVDLVSTIGHPGVILHWFLGDEQLVGKAVAAGCYFSVNSAMSDESLRHIPPDRMLPETDFPSTSRRGGGTKPGDTRRLETRVGQLLDLPAETIRWSWYRNLRAIALASGAIERLPDQLADRLLAV